MTMKLEIEFSQHSERAYGRIHKAGCRDLRDPEPLGEHDTLGDVAIYVSQNVWEDTEVDDLKMAPCARLPR